MAGKETGNPLCLFTMHRDIRKKHRLVKAFGFLDRCTPALEVRRIDHAQAGMEKRDNVFIGNHTENTVLIIDSKPCNLALQGGEEAFVAEVFSFSGRQNSNR